ncbi:MAG TPA: MMPL family transporter, partial [Microbacteriaceae bacterium]|nr:MMPL family transporter [Microbacteriaceae bacterium]
MAHLLYRLGRFVYRRPKRFLAAWFIALVAVIALGVGLGGKMQNSFAIPGTESQRAIDHLAQVFPAAAGASAQVVVQAPEGETISAASNRQAIESLADAIGKVDGVEQVLSPFSEYAGKAISDDGRAAYVQVQFDGPNTKVTTATKDAVQATAPIARDAGLDIAYGGDVFQHTEFGVTWIEGLGVLFAAFVLIITFGSLLAAGMPILTALIAVGISMGLVLSATAFATVSSTTPMLAIMLGLAVGIDYSLFILSRHRGQLANGMDPEESAASSVATAGTAVVFAGMTVIIALLGLIIVGIPFLSTMGVAAAVAVAVAMAAAVTMLPALLGLAKRRLIPKSGSRAARRARLTDEGSAPTLGRRWVNLVLRVPWLATGAVVVVLGIASVPFASMQLSLPTAASDPIGSDRQRAYELIEEGFGAGTNGPLIVTVDLTQTTAIMEALNGIADDLRDVPGVAEVGKPFPNPTADTGLVRVIPETAPDSAQTRELVERIRALAPQIADEYDTPIAVTGYTAVAIDISNRLGAALIPFAAIVVGLSLILLLLVFRSVFVPIKAALGFLLSAGAALGASVAVFQWGWWSDLFAIEHAGPLLSFLPILVLAILFGLAMDYEVFLTSGMREAFVHGGANADSRRAIAHGFQHAARVVTAAALIMFFVFFSFFPIGENTIRGIALALSVGILADAFLVRMTLGPALMRIAGRGAWWIPAWLDRILPNVDIEGDALRASRDAHYWAGSEDALASARDLVIRYRDAQGVRRELGPVSFRIDHGTVGLITGPSLQRRLVLLALAGRFARTEGDLQLLGIPASSEARALARNARLVDLETVLARADARGANRLERVSAALSRAQLGDARALLVAVPDTTPADLDQIRRAVVVAAAGLPIVIAG